MLADGRVIYHGEPVAAVVAETLDQAQAAAAAVARGLRGAAPASSPSTTRWPRTRRWCRTRRCARRATSSSDTNVLETALYAWGDTAAAAAEAAVVVENIYHFPMVTHFPIEPGGTVVVPTDGGGLEVYSPVQHPYLLQRTIAKVLGLSLSQVRVVAPDPGGGFGGKQNPKLEPLVAFLALRTGRTCRSGAVAGADLPDDAPRGLPGARPHRLHRRGPAGLPRPRVRLPHRRLRRRRPARDDQGQLRRGRPLPDPRRPDLLPRGPVQHHPEHRLPRLRLPAGRLGDGVADGRRRARARASTRCGCGGSTWSTRGEAFFRGDYEATADGRGPRAWTRRPS